MTSPRLYSRKYLTNVCTDRKKKFAQNIFVFLLDSRDFYSVQSLGLAAFDKIFAECPVQLMLFLPYQSLERQCLKSLIRYNTIIYIDLVIT